MSEEPPSHITSRRQIKLWRKQQEQNAAKRQKVDCYSTQHSFRCAERSFKPRHIPQHVMEQVLDVSQLLSLSNTQKNDSIPAPYKNIRRVRLSKDLRQENAFIFGSTDTQWQERALSAFILTDIPGLIIIPNPFTPKAQRCLIEHCLTDYTLPPNTSNLDAHYYRPTKGLWDLYERQQAGTLTPEDDDYRLLPKDNSHNMPLSSSALSLSPLEMLHKQRWITLGYQYDWKTKLYDLDHGLPMPEMLDQLSRTVVSAVEGVGDGLSWQNTYSGSKFKAEAGVINYYQLRDTLMAHVDKSEINMDAPLISVSFGHACIYLIGGSTKEVAPVPVRLGSGDLVIMTGSSRKSYHGVPRILENSLPDYLSEADWKLFSNYMSTARINLNIRQVFSPSLS